METIAGGPAVLQRETRFMWLEITGNCQLECGHCYADSGPGRGHGVVSVEQWMSTLADAAAGGVKGVQFIGGEPTAHPALPGLVEHALKLGLGVEVFSNLFSVRERVWKVLTQPGVTLATSYYSPDASFHDRVTNRSGSHTRTKGNIAEAVRRRVPIRVGLVRTSAEQDVDAAFAELVALGVSRDAIRLDDQRGVGRGTSAGSCSPENELCGRCADGVLAVMPDGTVQPCVFSRDVKFSVGNVTDDALGALLDGERLRDVRDELQSVFRKRGLIGAECPPVDPGHASGMCGPAGSPGPCMPVGSGGPCAPAQGHSCGPACSPSCIPMGNCNPVVNPGPCNPQAGHPPRPEPPTRPPGPVCNPY